ncbi:MAG: hypothetical protein ABI969_17125 [bacterium]
MGIPFYVEALTDQWLASGDLASTASVTRLIHIRFDAMDPAAERVLGAIAVLGEDASLQEVATVSGVKRSTFPPTLRLLEDAGIVRSSHGALTASRLWLRLALERAPYVTVQLLHLAAAECLEARNAKLDLVPTAIRYRIAEHWRAAGDDARARFTLARHSVDLPGPSTGERSPFAAGVDLPRRTYVHDERLTRSAPSQFVVSQPLGGIA